MPVLKPDVVDAIGRENDSGTIVLSLIDELDWRDVPTHLRHLNEKLNRYLAFVEAGEIFEHSSDVQGQAVRIDIVFRFTPPDQVASALFEAERVVASYRCLLHWTVHAT